MQQMTLNYDASITDSYATCREYVASSAHRQGVAMKAIAADMDYSPSDLSRKLAQSPNDSRRFTLDDLETYMQVTGDTSAIGYLAAKYLATPDYDAMRREIERLTEQLEKTNG